MPPSSIQYFFWFCWQFCIETFLFSIVFLIPGFGWSERSFFLVNGWISSPARGNQNVLGQRRFHINLVDTFFTPPFQPSFPELYKSSAASANDFPTKPPTTTTDLSTSHLQNFGAHVLCAHPYFVVQGGRAAPETVGGLPFPLPVLLWSPQCPSSILLQAAKRCSISTIPYLISCRIVDLNAEMVAAPIAILAPESTRSGTKVLGTMAVDGILLLASASRSGVPSGAAGGFVNGCCHLVAFNPFSCLASWFFWVPVWISITVLFKELFKASICGCDNGMSPESMDTIAIDLEFEPSTH